ncbi:hypothetical protein ACS0TY_035126 [Phlomoides rotata]
MSSKNPSIITPHLKQGDELEIKFITVASEDMTNTIQYPSFHFMKLQRSDQRASIYIKAQETKPTLVVNLTEDEVSTRRAWEVWAYLTKMDKVDQDIKHPTKGVQYDAQWKMTQMYLQFCATQEKPLFGNNFPVKKDHPGRNFGGRKGQILRGIDKARKICKKKEITIV